MAARRKLDAHRPRYEAGQVIVPEPPVWFDIWLRPVWDAWHAEHGTFKARVFEDRDYWVGFRYPNNAPMDPEKLADTQLKMTWPKAAWKPILGPGSDKPSPTIADVLPMPDSERKAPSHRAGDTSKRRRTTTEIITLEVQIDELVNRMRDPSRETTAAERKADKEALRVLQATLKSRKFDTF